MVHDEPDSVCRSSAAAATPGLIAVEDAISLLSCNADLLCSRLPSLLRAQPVGSLGRKRFDVPASRNQFPDAAGPVVDLCHPGNLIDGNCLRVVILEQS